MMFVVTLFSSRAGSVHAVGTWRVTADTSDQAIVVAKSRANSRLWPPDSAWMLIPASVDAGKRRANLRPIVSNASVRRSRRKAKC